MGGVIPNQSMRSKPCEISSFISTTGIVYVPTQGIDGRNRCFIMGKKKRPQSSLQIFTKQYLKRPLVTLLVAYGMETGVAARL